MIAVFYGFMEIIFNTQGYDDECYCILLNIKSLKLLKYINYLLLHLKALDLYNLQFLY